MTAKLFTLPKQFPVTNTGALIPGAKANFYAQGTSTPQNTYTTQALTTPHTNPVVADAYGVFAPIYLDPDLDYKVVLTTPLNVELYTEDNFANQLDAANIAIVDALNNFTATDVEGALAEVGAGAREVVDDTTPQLGGDLDANGFNVDMDDGVISQAELKDLSLTTTSPAIASGVVTFDMTAGNIFLVSLTENITSIVINNPPATGKYGWMKIRFLQDATGSRTVTGWPAEVDWIASSGAPTITTAATTGKDWVELTTVDAGASYDGLYGQSFV